ncbi:MAG: hypothetical protein IPM08_15965 [Actinomycetales bacterium]|nr:hypothetical protein [Actinomycetales bacterium]
MPHPVGVGVAGDVVIGERCHIMGLVRIGGSGQGGKPGHAVIGDDTWFMDGCKVLGPVHIGDRSRWGGGLAQAGRPRRHGRPRPARRRRSADPATRASAR